MASQQDIIAYTQTDIVMKLHSTLIFHGDTVLMVL